jgi:chemotaxis protein MotB
MSDLDSTATQQTPLQGEPTAEDVTAPDNEAPQAIDENAPIVPAGQIEEEEAPEECPPCKTGAPGWMATFADMATLLMAFFVLILSFSDTELPKFEQINGSIKAAFGIKKIVPTIKIPSARSLVVESFTPAMAQRSLLNQQTQMAENVSAENLVVRDNQDKADFEVEEEFRRVENTLADAIASGEIQVRIEDDDIIIEIAANASQSQSGRSADVSTAGQVNQRLIELSAQVMAAQTQVSRELQVFSVASVGPGETDNTQVVSSPSQADLQQRLERVRADLNTELQQGLVEVELLNNAIVIRLASQSSFVSGSAELQPSFLPLLTQVGQTIASAQGAVRVEGHTDNVPVVFSDRFNSNWDLSAVRAASVADYLGRAAAIAPERLSVKGFADTVPLATNASVEGRARNRRIEIIIDGD